MADANRRSGARPPGGSPLEPGRTDRAGHSSVAAVRAAYDAAAAEYAGKFCGELEHKPLDRELLRRLAAEARPSGLIYDLGCGPGQTTAFLASCGARVRGVDLSPGILAEARRRHPGIPFIEGSMFALPIGDGGAAALCAFYAIVHFDAEQLAAAAAEMRRVLEPGGALLLSFHVGDEVIRVDDFLGRGVSLDFRFFPVGQVSGALERAGFLRIEPVVREPYPGVEYPSRRAYLFARAPAAT